jgi:16S rRNA (cytosine1402-N4)-methyltransferase
MENAYHIPAMLTETIEGLAIKSEGVYVDVTLGGGGHSREILKHLNKKGKLYSLDQDLEAISRQQDVPENWQIIHSNFRYLANFMDYYGVKQIDGVLADLGVSFHHFDEAERGFSFRFDGPLDMRMNRQGGKTAADVVNNYSEEALARVLHLYGELPNAKQLARRIQAARPIATTWDLLRALTGSTSVDIDPRKKKEVTCAFQALRIDVNDELGALRDMLVAAKELLRPSGRIVILTYHSLEDRIVKNFLRSGNLEGIIEKDFYGNILAPFRLIEKGRTATEEEIERNPRARSAKLRVAEKI